MILRKAFQFKLKPNGANIKAFARFCGCARFVYNQGIEWNNEQRKLNSEFRFSYVALANLLPQWKQEWPWLAQCHSQVLQQALKDLERAFINFFEGRANFPKFHKKFKSKDSFLYPQGFKIDEGNRLIYLPKIGWVKYRRSRFISGKAKNVTVSRQADGWYVAIQTEQEVDDPIHPASGIEVGLDAGVVNTVTLSDGTVWPPVNALKNNLEKLAKLQRKLKRKTRFSKNWKKFQARIARLWKRIADIRRDHLCKISSDVCKNHAVIYREDLKITNMSASAAGTMEEPGVNVAQKRGLNRAILDQGWGMFFCMIEARQRELGGEVYAVPPQYTSQTCPECGCTDARNRPKQAVFKCVNCGFEGNADCVAAMNILGRGQRLRACGVLENTASHTKVSRRRPSSSRNPSKRLTARSAQ